MKRILLVLLLAATLAACTSSPPGKHPSTQTITSTVISTRPATANAFTPAPASSVKPLRPGDTPPKGETEKLCPYIRSGLDQDPTSKPNVADIQGNRVGRTTVLTGLRPVGCRFYFAYNYQAVADIVPQTFASPAAAHNAMVRTAQAGTGVEGAPNFVPGVDGISYRTRFFGPDGNSDWAFVFAKGTVLVVVHSEEKTTSQNALLLAKAVVGKF
ncbi:MAG: hypothetical protein ACR2LX_04355 [Jatrophihabitans sp.]